MIVYLVRRGDNVDEKTKLKAYHIDMQDFGSMRETLSAGKIVEIDRKLVQICEYMYSMHHGTGYYTYVEYNPKIYFSTRVESEDII